MVKNFKKKSDWIKYYKDMSNKKLISKVNEYKKYASAYKGTVLPIVAHEELARRKKQGLIRKNAGKKIKKSYGLW